MVESSTSTRELKALVFLETRYPYTIPITTRAFNNAVKRPSAFQFFNVPRGIFAERVLKLPETVFTDNRRVQSRTFGPQTVEIVKYEKTAKRCRGVPNKSRKSSPRTRRIVYAKCTIFFIEFVYTSKTFYHAVAGLVDPPFEKFDRRR